MDSLFKAQVKEFLKDTRRDTKLLVALVIFETVMAFFIVYGLVDTRVIGWNAGRIIIFAVPILSLIIVSLFHWNTDGVIIRHE